MQYGGLLIGLSSFLMIGLFHPIVIWVEYHWTKRCWPVFLLVGLALLAVSLFVRQQVASAIVAVTGFSCLWSIKELFEQEKRVKKGWFPKNPARETENSRELVE